MLLTIFQLRAGILTWNVITYRSLEFWLLRREEHDGWCGCTFRFQNLPFWSQGFASLCPWLYWIFIHRQVTRSGVTPFIFHMLSDIALKLSQCRPNPSFLSVFRIILTRACLEQNDPWHDWPRFLSFYKRNLNNRHVFVTIPDISPRKSLIPKVFLDCYCVAGKTPIRREKAMPQTNICQVSTHTEIHFIKRG